MHLKNTLALIPRVGVEGSGFQHTELSPAEEEKFLVLPSSGLGSVPMLSNSTSDVSVDLQITLPTGWDSKRTPCMSKVLWKKIYLPWLHVSAMSKISVWTRAGSGLGRNV